MEGQECPWHTCLSALAVSQAAVRAFSSGVVRDRGPPAPWFPAEPSPPWPLLPGILDPCCHLFLEAFLSPPTLNTRRLLVLILHLTRTRVLSLIPSPQQPMGESQCPQHSHENQLQVLLTLKVGSGSVQYPPVHRLSPGQSCRPVARSQAGLPHPHCGTALGSGDWARPGREEAPKGRQTRTGYTCNPRTHLPLCHCGWAAVSTAQDGQTDWGLQPHSQSRSDNGASGAPYSWSPGLGEQATEMGELTLNTGMQQSRVRTENGTGALRHSLSSHLQASSTRSQVPISHLGRCQPGGSWPTLMEPCPQARSWATLRP